MLINMLKSKISYATVSDKNLYYVGSITIDEALIEKAGFWIGEKVLVVSNMSGSRLETYVIAGKRNSGIICMNGASALLIKKGEEIIVSFREPEDQQRINSNDIRVKAKITSIHPIKKVVILVNGAVVEQFDGDIKEIDEPINLSDGVYEIMVKAENSKGTVKDNRVRIGINKEWNEAEPPLPTSGT